MRILFTLLVSTLICFTLNAQCEAGGSSGTSTTGGSLVSSDGFSGSSLTSQTFNRSFLSDAFKRSNAASNRLAYENINGSPYLSDESIEGTLVFNDNTIMNDVPLQVDLYTGQFIATNIDGDEVILDERFFKEIVVPFEGKNIVYKKTNPNNPDQFYEVLYQDGDLVFFKENYATLKEGINNGMVTRDSKFTARAKYFINQDEGGVVKVRLKKKEMFSGFIDSEIYAMKEYARRNGIKFKDEADYVAVFEGVNQ